MAFVSGDAYAQSDRVRVDKVSGGVTTTTYYNPGQTISITPTGVDRLHIYSDLSGGRNLTNIGIVNLTTGTITPPLEIEIGFGPTFPTDGTVQDPAGTHWAGIACSEPAKLHVAGNITGNLTGAVVVGQVWRLDIGGEVQAPITSLDDSSGNSAYCRLYVGEVTQDGPIYAEGVLNMLEVTGDVLAYVTSYENSVREVYIGSDLAASSFDPEEQPWILSKAAIGVVQVGGSLYGTIDATFRGYSNIQAVEVGGDVHGKVLANFITNQGVAGVPLGVRVGGDFNGFMGFYKGLDHDLIVDGAFGPDARIYLEEDGLRAQITFNDGNVSASWDNPEGVWVGFTQTPPDPPEPLYLLDEPYYPELPSDLGGGSVGLAPFNMHATACVPVDGETRSIDAELLINGLCLFQCDAEEYDEEDDDWFAFAVVRHYGPVEWASGDPFTVKRRSLACGGSETWTNVTSSFDFAINSGSGDREIKVTYTGSGAPDWPLDYEYLIEPVAGVLKSKGVNGSPDVLAYDYNFFLVADCGESFMSQYDRNHDDGLCSADIVAWSADPADLNDDSVIDEADLALLWEVVQTHGN